MEHDSKSKDRLKDITDSLEAGIKDLFQSEKYAEYLRTMSRFHQYSLNNTILIAMQRPDATLVAGYNKWRDQFKRNVKRGEKGIKIIAPTPFKKIVEEAKLDPNTKLPMLNADGDVVMEEKEIKIPMYKIVTVFDILQTEGEPILTELASVLDGNVRNYNAFVEALKRSAPVPISIIPLETNMDGYFDSEHQSISTSAAAMVLGTTTSEISHQILKQIEITIKKYEREKIAERGNEYGKEEKRSDRQTELHTGGRLSDSRSEDQGNEAHRQIREDAQSISQGTPFDNLQQSLAYGETFPAPVGDRPGSRGTDGTAHAEAGESGGRDGGIEREGSNALGGPHEQLQSAGGGNYPEGADLQLTLFPTEQEQIKAAESMKPSAFYMPFAHSDAPDKQLSLDGSFTVSQKVIDEALSLGGNEPDSLERICAWFAREYTPEENAAFLQREYKTSGKGFFVGAVRYAMLFDEHGIRIAMGRTARKTGTLLTWEDAAKRVRELLNAGHYAPQNVLDSAPANGRKKLAESIWYTVSDFSEKAHEANMLPSVLSIYNNREGFPKNVTDIQKLLRDSEKVNVLIAEYRRFLDCYAEDRDIMRFRFRRKDEILTGLNGLLRPALTFKADPVFQGNAKQFISEDEIDQLLIHGGNVENQQYRIYSFYQNNHTAKERADFIKHEYGTGGSSRLGFDESYDSKGITYSRGERDEDSFCTVQIKWPEAEKRIGTLIRQSRYMTEDEIAHFPTGEKQEILRDISADDKDESGRDASAQAVQLAPDLNEQPLISSENTIDIGEEKTSQDIDILLPEEAAEQIEQDEQALPDRTSDESPYKVGDTVYLEDGTFIIENISYYTVEMRDPSLKYPVLRAESKERFERLLYRDSRNSFITDYLAADLKKFDTDLYDALNNLLELKDKENIAVLFRNNMGNTRIAQRMAVTYAGIAETIDLITGETADMFATKNGFEIEIHDKYHSERSASWEMIVPVLRAMFQQEKDGFFHEPDNMESAAKEETHNADLLLHAETPAVNFRITDNRLGNGSATEKYENNTAAIRALKAIERAQRKATPEEQELLSRYVGWGGLADCFDERNSKYQELKALLTEDEYNSARASTLNAHYTSPVVIHAIYEAVANMGFTEGNVLEPACGIGNFFGLLPESMSESSLYGVELDSITGQIAKLLYPQAGITVSGYEKTAFPDSFFDLAIGNVPFGDYSIADKRYDKNHFRIHDYFFAKALDQVRPGGVVAFITSKGTMDKKSPDVRRYLAQRAELLGAIRLPNSAFKANAGTEVTSDIIFLQKRDRPITVEPDWVYLTQTDDGVPVNGYFAEHPKMVLGKMIWESGPHGMETACAPIEGTDLAAQLHEAIAHIDGRIEEAELPDLGEGENADTSIPADPNVKNYSYTVVDGEVYYRENSRMTRPELNKTAKERVIGMIGLRECVHTLMDYQLEDYPEEAISKKQAELNALYDSFSASYGLINARGNSLAFSNDSSYFLLCSLEEIDDDGNFKRKADMFTKRTIRKQRVVTSVDTADEALTVSIAEKARVDMEYMAKLSGKTQEELAEDLQNVIFRDIGEHDPSDVPKAMFDLNRCNYVTADEYLSGNVRRKLRLAKALAKMLPDIAEQIAPNISALEAVQPKDLEASEIDVRLGATWIGQEYIRQFMTELFQVPKYLESRIKVNYLPYSAEWKISNKSAVPFNDVAAYVTYGTKRVNAYDILEDTLNLRDVRIYDTVIDPDGSERRVLNGKETTLAQIKQQAIKKAFQDWIWKDPERRHDLVREYNERFNSVRPREYDGSHITFAGMNPEITLQKHQVDAVARQIYGGNTLLAHEVGAGKTYEMIASVMEQKRLGLCTKSIIVVPNHLTTQWASEFLKLYPSANILVTTKKDFETCNRKKFCARIATGDYDAVIIGHSQFERIPISFERQEMLLQEQIDEITEGIADTKANGGEHFTVKQMERTRKGLEAKLKKLQQRERKDDVVTFEQLGVDRLFVDEAHNYKNLFLYTKMRNVAGLSTSDAQKSSDMFAKCRYMDELTDGRGVIFATGTPVSNSMTEIYTMQRYLQYDAIKRLGFAHFDAWASTFGETVTAIELAPEGTGYRARTRFARFYNLPELLNVFKEVADIKTTDQLNLPVPKANYHTVVAKPTEQQKEMVAELSKRAANVHSGTVDPHMDNMLKITSDGRKLGLDQRIINSLLPDDPESKVNLCANNIFRIWDEGQPQKLTQLVFCDISTPQGRTKKTEKTTETLIAEESTLEEELVSEPFTVYDDIRSKLIAKGIPVEQIAFIHDANTEARKAELFGKVRSGQVRVLLGSTFKMGAGTNVQDRLIATHDLDCPWRPGDLEQRAGRIVRQGNPNPEVDIYRYVTDGTFDAYLWQTIENKQKFISQIMTSKSPVRSCEDVDETVLSYAEIKALCAGNPLIKEKMDLDIEVARLRILKADYKSQQYQLEDAILERYPKDIERHKGYIKGYEADLKLLDKYPNPENGFAGMVVLGVSYADKDQAGQALLESRKNIKNRSPEVGWYRGFKISLEFDSFSEQYKLMLKGSMSHTVVMGTDARGNLTRIENALSQIPGWIRSTQARLNNLYKQMEAAKAELDKPFPQEEELAQKEARLTELNLQLKIDKTDQEIIPLDEGGQPEEPSQEKGVERDEDERDER